MKVNMNGISCETCPYYYKFSGVEQAYAEEVFDADSLKYITGNCRKNPPVMVGGTTIGYFPSTHGDGWCGQHPDFDVC